MRYLNLDAIEIKRCPFCGGGDQFAPAKVHVGYNHTYVQCSYCMARTRRFQNPEEAINAWNRRA